MAGFTIWSPNQADRAKGYEAGLWGVKNAMDSRTADLNMGVELAKMAASVAPTVGVNAKGETVRGGNEDAYHWYQRMSQSMMRPHFSFDKFGNPMNTGTISRGGFPSDNRMIKQAKAIDFFTLNPHLIPTTDNPKNVNNKVHRAMIARGNATRNMQKLYELLQTLDRKTPEYAEAYDNYQYWQNIFKNVERRLYLDAGINDEILDMYNTY